MNAISQFETAVSVNPSLADAWLHLGEARMRAGQGDAESAFRKHVELAPTSTNGYLRLAEFLVQRQRHKEAAVEYERFIEMANRLDCCAAEVSKAKELLRRLRSR